MKKILGIALAIMLVPFTAFGLEMISDEAMDQVTGQAGVSIAVDDVELYLSIDEISWVDTDANAAGVVISNLEIANQRIDAITVADGYTLNDGTAVAFHALTIDASSALTYLDNAGVQIGLPTLKITTPGMYLDIDIAAYDDLDGDGRFTMTAGTANSFGQLYIGNQEMRILSGVVEIAPH